MVFTEILFSTHLLLKDSQRKQMDDHFVLFADMVVASKLSRSSAALFLNVSTSVLGKRKVIIWEIIRFRTL